MTAVYFTLTGTKHYFGQDFLEPGMTVILEKEPDNEYDSEAIAVKLEGLGVIGYVANSPYTVQGESFSAGRLYDKIKSVARGKIMYVTHAVVLCRLCSETARGRLLRKGKATGRCNSPVVLETEFSKSSIKP